VACETPELDEQQAWCEIVDRLPLRRGAELHARFELEPRRAFRALQGA
jgi:hypothetical protein